MTSHTNCCSTTCSHSCGTGSSYLIVLVVFILLAIILGSYFVF